jgi:hypothetical protein
VRTATHYCTYTAARAAAYSRSHCCTLPHTAALPHSRTALPRALSHTTERTATHCRTAALPDTAARTAIYYQAHYYILSRALRTHCRARCHKRPGALPHITARCYRLPHMLRTLAHSTAHYHPLPHCRTLPHCHICTAALPHITKRTAAHCRAHCHTLTHTAACTVCSARTLPCLQPHTGTHYRTLPRALPHTATHTAAHIRALPRCRTATHYHAYYHTLPSALPHTAAVYTATHCRSYCRTLPHCRTVAQSIRKFISIHINPHKFIYIQIYPAAKFRTTLGNKFTWKCE